MPEENRSEFNAIVSVLGDVLVELQAMRQENAESSRQIISAFNQGFTAMVDRLTSIETKLEQFNNYEERLRRLEEAVFRKGA